VASNPPRRQVGILKSTAMAVNVQGGVAVMIWYGGNMGWWGYAAMGIGMVLFWALVVGGLVLLIRAATTDTTVQPRATAEQILAARFAHGEITEYEYQDRLHLLRS
jgi:putative membrane protein